MTRSILDGQSVEQGVILPRNSGDGSGPRDLVFDVVMNETPSFNSTATENLIEDGAKISDHVTIDPVRLSLSGIVSNTPVSIDRENIGNELANPAKDAYEFLKRLRDNGEPFDLVTGFDIYTSMIIEKLSAPRTASNGSSLFFDLQLKQIRIVSSSIVTVTKFTAPSVPGAQSSLDAGKQTGKPGSEKAEAKGSSVLASLLGVFN